MKEKVNSDLLTTWFHEKINPKYHDCHVLTETTIRNKKLIKRLDMLLVEKFEKFEIFFFFFVKTAKGGKELLFYFKMNTFILSNSSYFTNLLIFSKKMNFGIYIM